LKRARRRAWRWSLTLALLAGCAQEGAPSVLDPHGPGARRIEGLWWLMLWISVAVFGVVLAFLVAAVVKSRRKGDASAAHPRWGEPFVVIGGIVVPSLILVAVFVVSLRDMAALSSPKPEPRITIEVVGHDWWWEVVYEEAGAVTANEIHVPVGEPVRLELTTDDVIHSFWVPQLQSKTDLIPGQTNVMWLEADEPGRYRGQCAEYCGLQHANMIFYIVAEPAADFRTWLSEQAADAPEPQDFSAAAGREVFLDNTCAGCHAIRGTEATATLGPDLTHLAARDTIASGVLDNTRSDLATWIVDPQGVKPGATMPPTSLTADELENLLDYLEQLE
jgi:cytochrome c oxidase subunit II